MITDLNRQLLEQYEKFPLFGIIIFTEEHPHVVKALKDKDYYAALNKISGEQIAVFATMLFRGDYDYPSPPPGSFARMYPIWKEPKENEQLLSWFDIKDSRDLPLFVLFRVESDELYYQRYPLKTASPQDVFNSLQEVLSAVAIRTQHNENTDKRTKFKAAQWEIKKLQIKQELMTILGAISLFRGVTGI